MTEGQDKARKPWGLRADNVSGNRPVVLQPYATPSRILT